MKKTLQELGNQAIGFVGEAIAKKLIKYSRWCIYSSFENLVERYPAINENIKHFLRDNWYSFDFVVILEKPCFKVQIIEVKVSTKRYKFKDHKQLNLTPKTLLLYKNAKKLDIEVLFLHIKFPERFYFYYDLIPLNSNIFGVSKGGFGKSGKITYSGVF